MTGEFFHEMTVDSLTAVMSSFKAEKYNPVAMREHAAKFDNSVFLAQMSAFIENKVEVFRESAGRHNPTR